MKPFYLFALIGAAFVLTAHAQTPPPQTSPPAQASAPAVPTHSANEQPNANPFKPKEVAPPPPLNSTPQPLPPPIPQPMNGQGTMTGSNGESLKRLGTLNGVTLYKGTDSYQFMQGATP